MERSWERLGPLLEASGARKKCSRAALERSKTNSKTVFSSTCLRDPILDPPGLRFGSLLALKMAETSLGSPLGAAKSRSRGLFFGPRAVQERSKRSPRPLQEASMRPRRSKKAPRGLWRPILTPVGPLRTSKTAVLGAPRACQEHSKRHPRAFQDILKQACCVKSFPRYSKTSRPGRPS